MKKTKLLPFVLALLMLVLTGCGVASTTVDPAPNTSEPSTSNADGPEEVHYIRLASAMNENDLTANPVGPATVYFMEQLKERTNGEYEVQIYLNNQLGSTADEIIGGCQTGAFEMVNYIVSNWSGYTTAFKALNIPYLFANADVVDAFIDSEMGEAIRQQCLEDTDIYILSFGDNGFRNVTNDKKEIHLPSDMKGMKIRTMSDPYQIATMEAFGAAVTVVPYSEMYSSLQQHLIDAQENPFTNIYSSRVYEVQKYVTATNHQYTFSGLFISYEYLKSLPEDIQEIIIQLGKEHEEMARQGSRELQGVARKNIEDYGCIVTDLTDEEFDAFRDTAKTIWEPIREELGTEYFDQLVSTVNEIEDSLK